MPDTPATTKTEAHGPIFHVEPFDLAAYQAAELEAARAAHTARAAAQAGAAADEAEADDATESAADEAAEEAPIHVVLSSETPCDAYFGSEIWSHQRNAIDMSLAKQGLSMYLEHGGYPVRILPDPEQHIGSVENIQLKGTQLEGDAYFSKHPLARRVRTDVLDGRIKFGSTRGYPIKRKVVESTNSKSDARQVIWTRWRPEEFSWVGIPADATSGKARAAAGAQFEVETEYFITASQATHEEESAMPDKPNTETTPTPAAAAAAGGDSTVRSAGAGGASVMDRDETGQLVELCISHGCPERASDFIRRGVTRAQAGLEILEGKRGRQATSSSQAIPASAEELGFKKRDLKRYSVSRALLQMCEVKTGARKNFDGFEGEMHAELDKVMPQSAVRHGGILIPLRLERDDADWEGNRSHVRALGSNVPGGGAELVADRMLEPIELLTNRALVAKFGAQVYSGLSNTLQIPRETSDVSVNWMRENPSSPAAQSSPGYGFITVSGKTMIGSVPIPKQLLRLSSIDVHNRVNYRLMTKHGLLMDRGTLHGRGTDGEPTGLYNTPGVQTLPVGGVPGFSHLIDMESAIADVNADAETMAYMTTPKMAGRLKKTLDYPAAAAGRPIWTGKLRDAEMNGYRAGATKQVSGTLSGLVDGAGVEQGLIYGDWSQVGFFFWGAFEATTDEITLLEYGSVKVVTFQMFDSAILRPEAFIVATGATLS